MKKRCFLSQEVRKWKLKSTRYIFIFDIVAMLRTMPAFNHMPICAGDENENENENE